VDAKGSRIAEGRTDEIFAWGEDRVLKLFRRDFPPEVVERETRCNIAARIKSAKGLPVRFRRTALRELNRLPTGGFLCHGDFHPDNVIWSERGPVVIDWLDANRGDPAADVARTPMLISIGETPDGRLEGDFIEERRRFIGF